MGEEKVYMKKDWGPESFGNKKNFLLNFCLIFCQTKYFGQKKIVYRKQFDKKKWVKKNSTFKKFCSTQFVSKTLLGQKKLC